MNKYNEADKASLESLLQLEEELSIRLEKLKHDLSKSHSRDSTEQATERENDEVINSLESETQEELHQVKNAIKRIEQGKYHICTECDDAIHPERLSAIPYTTLCILCAVNHQ